MTFEGCSSPKIGQVPNPADLAVVRSTAIVTGRYRLWRPEHGVAVQITVGTPKFGRWPDLVDGRIMAPFGLLSEDMPTDEARRRYRQRLDDRADRVVAALASIATRHPNQTLCLLCFEDVHAGEECHRRWLADWLDDRYGIVVPEATVVDQQPTLFD
jgi:hypothetical protein